MKYLLLFFVMISNVVAAQTIPGTLTRWKMDSNCELIDEIADSPSYGVLNDVTLTSNKDNVANSALSFGANTSYITLGAVDKLKLADDKSISFWINPFITGGNRTGSIFVYGTGINIRYIEQASAARLEIVFGNTQYIQVALTANQWQAITITFTKDFSSTKSKAFVYKNAVFVNDAEQNKSAHDFTNAIAMIGPASQSTLTNGFRGSLDAMMIFNRTLTATEVTNAVLPVKLEFFKGRKISNGVELSWKSEMEENVSHFDIQKSIDGIHFNKISTVEAGKFNYLENDNSPVISPFAWYRLEIIDKDGKKEFSNIIKVSLRDSIDSVAGGVKLFPNPGARSINFTGITTDGDITILNFSGAVVKQKKFTVGQDVNISDLMPGLYYVVHFDGNKRTIFKFYKR